MSKYYLKCNKLNNWRKKLYVNKLQYMLTNNIEKNIIKLNALQSQNKLKLYLKNK
jgi:hypothetical protein